MNLVLIFLSFCFQKELEKVKDKYLLIDCPGQVELYTHNNAVRNIVSELLKVDIRLVAVHLVDSHYCRHVLIHFIHYQFIVRENFANRHLKVERLTLLSIYYIYMFVVVIFS